MAGSEDARTGKRRTEPKGTVRRRNIHGHTIVADAAMMAKLRRLAGDTLNNLFRQAREQGMAPLRMDDEPYIITRHPDHTFTIISQDQRNHPVL